MESISAEFPLLFLPLSSAAAVASRRVAAKIGNLNAGVAVAVGCSGEGEGRARPTFRSLFHDRATDRVHPNDGYVCLLLPFSTLGRKVNKFSPPSLHCLLIFFTTLMMSSIVC